jgi:hypothetical protein
MISKEKIAFLQSLKIKNKVHLILDSLATFSKMLKRNLNHAGAIGYY